MKLIKYRLNFFWLAILMAWVLSSCASPEERIKAQFDTLPKVDATLLYKHGGVSSSAIGDCVGTFQDRWYSTTMDAEKVAKLYSDYLTDQGWSVRAEEVVEIWSREGDEGLYRVGIDIFTDPKMISQQQADYELPVSVLAEADHHPTIYLLSMVYMSSYAAKKCFGH